MERIETLVKALQDAWNTGNAKAWANLFTPDVEFINIYGQHKTGSDNVQASHARTFSGIYKDSRNVFQLEEVSELAPGLHAVLMSSRLDYKTGGHDARMTAIVKDIGGEPKIAWFHNCFITQQPGAAQRKPDQAKG